MPKAYPLRLAELTCTEYRISHQAPVMWLVSAQFCNFDLLKAFKNRDSRANIAKLMARSVENETGIWSLPLTHTASWIADPKNIGAQLSAILQNLQGNSLNGQNTANPTWDDFGALSQSWHLVPHGKNGVTPSVTRLTLEGFYQDFFHLHGGAPKNGVMERGFFLVNGEQGQQDNFIPIYTVENSNGVARRIEHLDKAGLTEWENFTRQEARQRHNLFEHSNAAKPVVRKIVPPPPIVKSTTPEPPVPVHLRHVPPQMRDFVDQWVRDVMAHDPTIRR